MLEQSVSSLLRQLRTEGDFLTQRRPLGLSAAPRRKGNNNFSTGD